jgi:hypothetical protein
MTGRRRCALGALLASSLAVGACGQGGSPADDPDVRALSADTSKLAGRVAEAGRSLAEDAREIPVLGLGARRRLIAELDRHVAGARALARRTEREVPAGSTREILTRANETIALSASRLRDVARARDHVTLARGRSGIAQTERQLAAL